MPEQRPNRHFQQRLIDTFDRSRLRHEVQKARRKDSSWLKKRYATMVLGASLAVSGIGIPLKMNRMVERGSAENSGRVLSATSRSGDDVLSQVSGDLAKAGEIANEVTGGVNAATSAITQPLRGAAGAAADTAGDVASKSFKLVNESQKENFFKAEIPFGHIIYQEAKNNDIKPELLAAVVQQESKFNPTARSNRGAVGLMQLVPKTGRWMGARNLTNPAENVRAGAKYLKYLNDQFNGDQKKVIAAYNAGEGNVRRFGGIPPFRETQKYVTKVMNFQQDFEDRVAGTMADNLSTGAVAGQAAANVLK